MNLETLQYFRYIAKYKNITNAAKHLYVSQSTLSRHIMALENELGVRLFDRNNKQIELTEAGKVFYKDSASFVDHMEAVVNNAQYAAKGYTGILRITLPCNMYDVLSKPLAILRESNPFIRLVLESYDFNEIPSAIKYNLYNIGLTYNFALMDREAMEQENIDSFPVKTDNFSLIAPSEYAVDETKETISRIVSSLPLILPSHVEPPFMKQMLSQFQGFADTKIISTLYVNTTESVLLNVSSGLGYSIVPTSWASTYYGRNDISFINLPDIQTKCSIVMLYKKSSVSELVNNFVNIVKGLSEA